MTSARTRWVDLSLGRTRRRRALSVATLLVGGIASADAFLIEPYWLETTRHTTRGPVRKPLKVAHVTDLHTRGYGLLEQRLVSQLDAEQPDLIAVTGDTVDDGNLEAARPLFAKLHAPLGVWVVRGNWENWRRPTVREGREAQGEAAFYASVGAHFLDNEGALARDDVWVGGVDDPMSGHALPKRAATGAPNGVFGLGLVHSPEGFDESAPFALTLAGHTHGGQVRLPIIGALWLPPGSGPFIAGWYSAGKARMYVSRGIGTSILPVRFWCRPELAIITVTE